MQLSLLASGSKGNALLVAAGQTRLLVDAGLSCREICRRLCCVGVAPESVDAVLITHEHGDHVRGLGPLMRRLGVPVFIHTDTLRTLRDPGPTAGVREFEFGADLSIGDLAVRPFPITHDAVAPAGFTIEGTAGKVGVATDLGIATRLVAQQLSGCRALVLESNHDEEMLRDGPYPWPLKQRVQGSHGHLSNRASAELLQGLFWEGLETVLLAHLSDTNNRPELALAAAREMVGRQNCCRPQLLVGAQDEPTPLVTLK